MLPPDLALGPCGTGDRNDNRVIPRLGHGRSVNSTVFIVQASLEEQITTAL